MVVDDIGTRASLRVLVIPLEGIDECITDRDSCVGTAGTSDNLRAASVIIDDNSSGLLLIAKLLRKWLVDEIDGRNGWVVAIPGGDYLNDLVRVMYIAVLGPGGIQRVLARIIETIL